MKQLTLILLRGYPGSGKTTVGKLLSEVGLGTFIDHNAILTFLASIAGDDDGLYDTIHNLEQAMTRKLLRENKSVIVARGFSSATAIQPYLDIAEEASATARVIRLAADKSVLSKRVVGEERQQDFNPVTSEHALTAWIAANPLEAIEHERIIDANQPVDKIVAQIQALHD